jgi:tyrosine-protein kinase receptor torso
MKVVHGDLSARNVLLDKNNTVKISDFGLSRSLHKIGFYKETSGENQPMKWMALETIYNSTFNSESDVWSYGENYSMI